MTWIPDKELWRKRGTYKGNRYSFTAKQPEEVVEKIKAFEAQIDKGVALDNRMTLYQYIQRWYPLKIEGLKPKSREAYKNAIDNHIVPKLGNILIRDVKPMHIDELLAGMEGKSASLRQKVLNTLRQVFNSAIENSVVEKNPCYGRKAGGEKTKPKVPLTREQQAELTIAVRDTRAELFTLLCLYAGLRREEALGLLWSNVHLDAAAPYIDVRNTTTFESSGKSTHSSELKSAAAYRTIPIPPQLSEALLRWRGKKDSIFVIPAEGTNQKMTLSSFRRMWDIVVGYTYKVPDKEDKEKKIKRERKGVVDFHVEPHQLRHTYITELCASGMDIKKIQYLAGHATVQMTLNVYAHATQNKPEQLAPDIIKTFSRTPTGIPDASGQ